VALVVLISYYLYNMRFCMSSILLPKESVILFLASFSGKDKAEIHFEERDGITPQITT
jgi:hypothetical protein